jgi:hypothetical protein
MQRTHCSTMPIAAFAIALAIVSVVIANAQTTTCLPPISDDNLQSLGSHVITADITVRDSISFGATMTKSRWLTCVWRTPAGTLIHLVDVGAIELVGIAHWADSVHTDSLIERIAAATALYGVTYALQSLSSGSTTATVYAVAWLERTGLDSTTSFSACYDDDRLGYRYQISQRDSLLTVSSPDPVCPEPHRPSPAGGCVLVCTAEHPLPDAGELSILFRPLRSPITLP